MFSYLLLQTLVPKPDTFGATFVVIGALVPGVDPLIAMCFYIPDTCLLPWYINCLPVIPTHFNSARWNDKTQPPLILISIL